MSLLGELFDELVEQLGSPAMAHRPTLPEAVIRHRNGVSWYLIEGFNSSISCAYRDRSSEGR